MKPADITRKTLTSFFAIGATLALALLSFAGMYVFTSSLAWCGAAFVLAAAYEGQVNAEGITSGFRRMFDAHYLKHGILRQFLHNKLKVQKNSTNLFLKAYQAQKKYVEGLEKIHHHLINLKKAQKKLQDMESFFFRQFDHFSNREQHQTEMEEAARELLTADYESLKNEIKQKRRWIRLSWLFAIGGGVSSGLVAYSAMQGAIAAGVSILAMVPGGVLITLAMCAAVGCTLLLCHTIAEMVQEFSGDYWKTYFKRRLSDNPAETPDETELHHRLRCAATVFAISIAIIATIATVGTFWYAAKNGATLLGMANKAANILRTFAVSFMALPTAIFNMFNSVKSIDKISRSKYLVWIKNQIDAVVATWEAEKKNLFRFLNPFRLVEKIISCVGEGLLFLGHIISMGLMVDRFEPLTAPVCIAAEATTEGLTDINLLPDEEDGHSHHSFFLMIVRFPIQVTVNFLKAAACLWDLPFSKSLTESRDKMFGKKVIPQAPNQPVLEKWDDEQNTIEVCKQIQDRLRISKKSDAAKDIEKRLRGNNLAERELSKLHDSAKPFVEHRSPFWRRGKTQSQTEMEDALATLENSIKI